MKSSAFIPCIIPVYLRFTALFFSIIHGVLALNDPIPEGTEQENNVLILRHDTAPKIYEQNRVLLVMCYVPWDRKYQQKIFDYEQVAEIVMKSTEDVQLAKLDMASDPDLTNYLELEGQDLQFILFYKGRAFNVAEFSDAASLSKRVRAMADPKWSPPEVPVLLNRVKLLKTTELEKLRTLPFAVVMFYKEKSPAADRLLYDFENAVHSLKDVPKPFRFYKLDATNAPNTLEKYAITSLPQFKIFRHGKHYNWNGPMVTAKGISGYIRQHMLPPLTEIPNPQEMEKYLKQPEISERPTVVGFFQSTTLERFPLFVEAAQQCRDRYNFVVMSTPLVANNGGEPQQAPGWTMAVLLPTRHHTPDDEKRAVLQHETASFEMMMEFIRWKATPLAGERLPENEKTHYDLRPLVIVYGKVDWSKSGKKNTEYWRDKVASAAKDNKDILFSIADRTRYAHETERFGFSMDQKYDLHVGILGKDGEYYPRWETTHMSSKMIGEFVKQFKAGEIKPFHRTKEPSSKFTGKVIQLSGASFKSEILKGDAFTYAAILLYHPVARNWRLAEDTFKAFAEDDMFKKKDVKFYQIDMSQNDIPAYFNITTYPQILMLHKDARTKPERYEDVLFDQINLRNVFKAMIKSLRKLADPALKNTEL